MNPENNLSLLADLLLKSVLVLVLAISTARLWRSASAATRHMVLLAAFILLLLLPFAKMTAPHWGFGLHLPRTEMLSAGGASHQAGISLSERRGYWFMTHWNWPRVAVLTWLAGTALLLCYRVAGGLQLRTVRSRSRFVVCDRLISLTRQIACANGIEVELRESNSVCAPMTWGIWRPVILLPSSALEWSDEHLIAALLHECGHIRRRDCFTRLLAQIATAIYWINPLVWIAARQMHLEQEMACDDIVLRGGIGATDYATQLVAVVRSLQGPAISPQHALAMAHPSTLEARVQSIVEERQNRRPLTGGAIAASTITLSAILLLFTFAEIRAADSAPASGSSKPVKPPTTQPGDAKAIVPGVPDSPISITAIQTKMEDGIAVARGDAVLEWKTLTIKADVIKYNPEKRDVIAIGHVRLERHDEHKNVAARGGNLSYNLETQKLICDGPVENTPK